MKIKLLPLLFLLSSAILPCSLRADSKIFTEADALAPISVNKGDTITFSLKSATPGPWIYSTLVANFSDPTIPANDPNAFLLSADADSSTTNLSGTSISDVFVANNSGQMVLVFIQTGADPVFKCEKAITFVINIK